MLARVSQSDLRWPPSDTEESVVGTDWHQTTLMNVRWAINGLARAAAGPDEPAPWQASSQILIRGFSRRDLSPYSVMPDVFVYRKPFARERQSLSLLRDGAPVLIVEVVSESSAEVDADPQAGKGWVYAHAGVQEYVVLDPSGLYMDVPLRGWYLADDRYQNTALDAQGVWHSRELPLAIGFPDDQVAVYDRDGRRQLREGEISALLALHREDLAQYKEDLAQKDAEIAALRRRLEDLERG
jgi:Uma2 family endonuclease